MQQSPHPFGKVFFIRVQIHGGDVSSGYVLNCSFTYFVQFWTEKNVQTFFI